MKAIIILGHGSRAEEANNSLYDVVEMVAGKIKLDLVGAAFLGHAQPNLETAISEMAAKGVNKITIVPLFLFQGIHMQEDIPRIVKQLEAKYQVTITLARHLGADSRVADILVDRIQEVI